MQAFMDQDFMLYNEMGRRLFHTYAEQLPIIDYHCHLSPQEIYEDRRYNNLTELWLGGRDANGGYAGDHYKWRLMRANGAAERYVTGEAAPFERFKEFAKTLEMAIGNPLYHWSNMELHQYFGITEALTPENAEEIWEKTSALLQQDPAFSVRGIIRKSKVKFIGTTDDPIDSLEWHAKLAELPNLGFTVCPSFRPDKAVNIQKPGFAEYIGKLAASAGKQELPGVQDVIDALSDRIDYFKRHGCKASDHGLDYFPFRLCDMLEVNRIYRKALAGAAVSREEAEAYQTTLLLALAKKYHREDIVMEIHYNVTRNNNAVKFRSMGADTGYDMIKTANCGDELAQFWSELEMTDELPKTVVFSLNANDFNQLATNIACFQGAGIPGKMQLGAAWWFLDSRDGMELQMRALANNGLLGNFIGMLTDSRSFLSYARHDYFRRIACSLIGKWVEDGEYPNSESSLKKIVEGICSLNAERYFGI